MSLAIIRKTILKFSLFKVFSILLMIRLNWKTWKIQLFLIFLQFIGMSKTANLKTLLARSIENCYHIFWKMRCKLKTWKKIQKNKWVEKILWINFSIKRQMMSKQIWTSKSQMNAAKMDLRKHKMKTWKFKDRVLC